MLTSTQNDKNINTLLNHISFFLSVGHECYFGISTFAIIPSFLERFSSKYIFLGRGGLGSSLKSSEYFGPAPLTWISPLIHMGTLHVVGHYSLPIVFFMQYIYPHKHTSTTSHPRSQSLITPLEKNNDAKSRTDACNFYYIIGYFSLAKCTLPFTKMQELLYYIYMPKYLQTYNILSYI